MKKHIWYSILIIIFIVSINLTIFYVGMILSHNISTTIAKNIHDNNNLIPVITSKGYYIFNRQDHIFYQVHNAIEQIDYNKVEDIPFYLNKIVYVNDIDKQYHKSNCSSLSIKCTATTLSNAKNQGLLRCTICRP